MVRCRQQYSIGRPLSPKPSSERYQARAQQYQETTGYPCVAAPPLRSDRRFEGTHGVV